MRSFRFLQQRREESIEITVEHLEDYLADKLKQHTAPLCAQADKNRSRLKAHFSDLRNIGLEIADFQPRLGEAEAPYAGVINASKEALTTAAVKEWDVGSNTPESFEEILELKDAAELAAKNLLNVCSANRKIGYTFLKGPIKKLEGKIRSIADEAANLNRLIEKHRSEVESWRQVLKLAQEHADLLRKSEESEETAKQLREEITRLDDEISKLNSALQSWLHDPQYIQIGKLEHELNQLEKETEQLRSSIKETLASLRRAFGKYGYLVSADKRRAKLLEDFEDLPILLNRENYDDVAEILSDIEKCIAKGEIQLKNSSRVIASLHTLQTDLPIHADKHRELQQRTKEVRARLMSSPRDTAENLQTSLNELRASKLRLEDEMTNVSKSSSLYQAQAAQKAEQLKDSLRRLAGLNLVLHHNK